MILQIWTGDRQGVRPHALGLQRCDEFLRELGVPIVHYDRRLLGAILGLVAERLSLFLQPGGIRMLRDEATIASRDDIHISHPRGQPSDVLLFREIGINVALVHASDEVGQRATLVSFGDEGFANAIERFILPRAHRGESAPTPSGQVRSQHARSIPCPPQL